MVNTTSIIDQLWESGEVVIPSKQKGYRVVFTRPDGFFDIVMDYDQELMGFITLKKEGNGIYSIVNDTTVNPHPSFINTPGHGIEVQEGYRKRGVGAALLSIGIGIVQHDWLSDHQPGNFNVIASDITSSGFGCYQNFGFVIEEGLSVSTGYYQHSDSVSEINILPRKAFILKRLKKRLRL